MSARVYETITRHRIGPWNVRVWRATHADGSAISEPDAIATLAAELADRALFDQALDCSAIYVRDSFLVVAYVAAVEVTNDEGTGILGYNDWP